MTGVLAIVRVGSAPSGLDVDAFATVCGLHPDMIRKFVALGLLEPRIDEASTLWFRPADLARVARIQRLRAGFGLNYAGIGLVLDLLDRLAERGGPDVGGRSWTSIG